MEVYSAVLLCADPCLASSHLYHRGLHGGDRRPELPLDLPGNLPREKGFSRHFIKYGPSVGLPRRPQSHEKLAPLTFSVCSVIIQ